jgi:hypothetical protein
VTHTNGQIATDNYYFSMELSIWHITSKELLNGGGDPAGRITNKKYIEENDGKSKGKKQWNMPSAFCNEINFNPFLFKNLIQL